MRQTHRDWTERHIRELVRQEMKKNKNSDEFLDYLELDAGFYTFRNDNLSKNAIYGMYNIDGLKLSNHRYVTNVNVIADGYYKFSTNYNDYQRYHFIFQVPTNNQGWQNVIGYFIHTQYYVAYDAQFSILNPYLRRYIIDEDGNITYDKKFLLEYKDLNSMPSSTFFYPYDSNEKYFRIQNQYNKGELERADIDYRVSSDYLRTGIFYPDHTTKDGFSSWDEYEWRTASFVNPSAFGDYGLNPDVYLELYCSVEYNAEYVKEVI